MGKKWVNVSKERIQTAEGYDEVIISRKCVITCDACGKEIVGRKYYRASVEGNGVLPYYKKTLYFCTDCTDNCSMCKGVKNTQTG